MRLATCSPVIGAPQRAPLVEELPPIAPRPWSRFLIVVAAQMRVFLDDDPI